MKIRPTVLFLHRWVGLIVGLFLVVQGSTGAILAFQREIDAALNPALFRASGPADPTINYAAVLRLAEENSGKPVQQIRPPDAVWPVWVAFDRRQRGQPGGTWASYVDPATGHVLGRRDISASFVNTVHQLHEFLWLREHNGRTIVGWIGFILMAMAITGIWTWWPRRGASYRDALTLIRRRPFTRFNLDLHQVAGIWICVVFLSITVSGTAIIFPNIYRGLLGIEAPARPAPAPPRRDPFAVDADAAVAAATQAVGPHQVVSVLIPPGPGAPRWQVTFRPEGSSPEARVRSAILVDPWSGAVLAEISPRTRSWAEEALALQRWLHGGSVLGMPGRIAVFLAGLSLPLLFTTGLLAWLGRRRAQRATQARRAAALAGARPLPAGGDTSLGK